MSITESAFIHYFFIKTTSDLSFEKIYKMSFKYFLYAVLLIIKFVQIAAITGSKPGDGVSIYFGRAKPYISKLRPRCVFCLTLYCIFIVFFLNNLSQ
jgi:hypothetical protein